MSDNRRRFTRVDFVTDAGLESGGHRYPARILNLSLQGALLEVAELGGRPLPDEATIHLQLNGSTIEMSFQALLVHRQDTRLGYRFDAVGQESMIHLRTLLEYNLGDPERVREEVQRLVDD